MTPYFFIYSSISPGVLGFVRAFEGSQRAEVSGGVGLSVTGVRQGEIINESAVMSLCQASHLDVWLSETSEAGQACIITEATQTHLHDKTWPPGSESQRQVKTQPFIFSFPQLLLILWAIQHTSSENTVSYIENFLQIKCINKQKFKNYMMIQTLGQCCHIISNTKSF